MSPHPGFGGNLSKAEQRREWLKGKFKLKDGSFLYVGQIADNATSAELNAKTLGKLVFVFGDELDDHDCELKPFGIDHVLERYATVIRRLRGARLQHGACCNRPRIFPLGAGTR